MQRDRFQIQPDTRIEIDEPGAIELLCRPFAKHDKGLPEWVKNAAGAYDRFGAVLGNRVIVLLFANRRASRPAAIGCLDFVGMTEEDIAAFKRWADPNAAGRGCQDFRYGGHGSGGKCYMLRMFEDSDFRTVRDGVGNRIGFVQGDPQHGYAPDEARGRCVRIENAAEVLADGLAEFGVDLKRMPAGALELLDTRESFTLVMGRSPREIGQARLPVADLIDAVLADPQMIDAIETCSIYAFEDGRPLNSGQKLSLPPIEPVEHYESPRQVDVPSELEHPETGQRIPTVDPANPMPGKLVLRTSKDSMPRSWKRLRHRHRVVFRTRQGTAGYRPVRELVSSGRGDRVYGECYLEILAPRYVRAERDRLVEAPLTEALEAWIADQIVEFASEFEEFETLNATEKERQRLQELNAHLDAWKNAIMDNILSGMGEGRANGTGGGPKPGDHAPKPRPGEVARIELERKEIVAGMGVTYRPQPRCFDGDDRLVARPQLTWYTSDPKVAEVDGARGLITTHQPGMATVLIRADSGAEASIRLRVQRIATIELSPLELVVGVGHRKAISAVVRFVDGTGANDALLKWESLDPDIVYVGPWGVITGNAAGTGLVTARDVTCAAVYDVEVRVEESHEGDPITPGSGPPRVLLSEIDDDPFTGEPVSFLSSEPPVHQRVSDVERGIFWINTSAPLARRYLDEEMGYGVESREWRVYHIERYVDVLAKVVILQDEQEDLSAADFVGMWEDVQVQLQAAAARDLGGFLDRGELC